MAGLLTNANYINDTIKPAIKSAIEAQGVTVPSTDSFLDYADRIAEIEGGGGDGYVLQDLPTGSISSFSDGVDLPLNSLKVSIEAVQSGSGDPSPSNVRPISGFDEVNIFNGSKGPQDSFYKTQNTNVLPNATTTNVTINSNDSITVAKIGGTSTYASTRQYLSNYSLVSGQRYTMMAYVEPDDSVGAISIRDSNNTSVVYSGRIESNGWAILSFDYNPTTMNYLSFFANIGSTANKSTTYSHIIFVRGDIAKLTIPLSSTCYGGELDVTSGILKARPYYASYNGETLVGPWISSMDEYTQGGTPTTGAQVVDMGGTETTIQVQPTAIRTLDGDNNLWADCGEVIEGEYFSGSAPKLSKADYQIGGGNIKMIDSRYLSGFASMSNYGAYPIDTSDTWLDVDWSKSFEVGVRFKLSQYPASNAFQYVFGCGLNGTTYRFYAPSFLVNSSHKCSVQIGASNSSWLVSEDIDYTINLDTWYLVRVKFDKDTMAFAADITTDFETYTSLYNATVASVPYHDAASLAIGGDCRQSDRTTNYMQVDTHNTYIKDNSGSIVWGAYKGGA